MTEFSNRQIPPPLNWEEFESLCCDLWGELLNDSSISKNGRSGQAQNGVDVIGRKNGRGSWTGVQCKGKDGRYNNKVTERELREEVEKAKSFEPKISSFILVTTADNDAKIQKVARELSVVHEKEGLFSVAVMGWSEIIRKLAAHESIIEKYYPNQSLRLKSIEKNVESLVDSALHQDSHALETNKKLSEILSLLKAPEASRGVDDGHSVANETSVERVYNEEIDAYRDTLRAGKPKTSKELLLNLKDRCWDNVSDYIKFRIITNIAASDLRLGNDTEAISGFRSAFQYAEDNEIANANLILADIVEKDFAAAHSKSISALKQFPSSEAIVSYYIASHPLGDSSFNPVECVPEELSESGRVAYSIYGYYRGSSDSLSAREWIQRAYKLDPEGFEIRVAYSADLLEPLSLDQAIFVGEQVSLDKREQLAECREILSSLFNEIVASEEQVYFESISNNLVLTLRMLGDRAEAFSVVETALNYLPDSQPLLQLKAGLHIDVEEWQKALSILGEEEPTNSFKLLLMKIEAFGGLGDYSKPQELINQYLESNPTSDKRDFLESYLVDLLYNSNSYDKAIEYGEKSVLKDISVQTYIAMSKVHRRNDNIECAKQCTLSALKNLDDDHSYGKKFIVAEEAYFCGLLMQAKSIFEKLTLEYIDSPPLRRLIACLYELDDRQGLLELLDSLPIDLFNESFYSKYAAAFYTRVGDFEKAEQEIDKYLLSCPSDLNAVLNKVAIYYRTDRSDQVHELIESLVDIESQPPLDQMSLAFIYADLGKELIAIETAYQLRRKYVNNPDVHQKYIGLIFSDRVSGAIKEFKQVEMCTSAVVTSGETCTEYYICGEGESSLGDNELAMDHPISIALLGSKVGQTVEYEENPVTTKSITVEAIKSKYIYLLHNTMDKFSHRFPAENSLFKFELEEDADGNLDFSPIFRSLDQRRSYVDHGMSIYRDHPMPVGVLARYLNTDPVDLWLSLQKATDVKIYSAQGSYIEREGALRVMDSRKQYVVDPLTAVTLIDLELIDVVEDVLGKLSITRSSLDLITGIIEERRQFGDKRATTLGKVGDDYVKHETTHAEVEAKTNYLKELKKSFENKFEIVSAIGYPASSQEMNQFLSNVDPSFIDTLYAAANDGWALLSDDLRLRGLASLGWSIESLWVQPVMLKAREKGLIEAPRYAEIVYQYINRNFDFISVDRHVLFELAKESSFLVSEKFLKVCATLGSEHSDIESCIGVAAGAINDIWAERKDKWMYEAFVYSMLNVLTANCTKAYTSDLLIYLDDTISKSMNGPFRRTIRKWTEGHFLIGIF